MNYPILCPDIHATRYRRLHAVHLPHERFARFYQSIADALDALTAAQHTIALVSLEGRYHLLLVDIDPDDPYTDAQRRLTQPHVKEEGFHG